ncbi:MAG: exopolysaccharide biosynthesis polyprenyl glycosylphosphotransferase [Methylobacter sp.]
MSSNKLYDIEHGREIFDEIICERSFYEHLRNEKMRAERSKSSLSIILLKLENQTPSKSINQIDILKSIRAKTRSTDICDFVNHKTIGILLPDTDETGAKEICEKLINGNEKPQFSITASTYPHQIFESLTKNGYVQADAFPFELLDSVGPSLFSRLLKRGVDILGSIIGIILLMPLILIVALVIKLDSSGPVIFSQIRLGKKGVPFVFYKFRSMRVDADDQIHREYVFDFINGHNSKINQGSDDGPFFKIKSDPRITKVGRFLRKTSIDELPQLFNVLKGDMSLIGPRPPLPYEVEKYQSWHLTRILEMKPGITGLWQVEGRSKTEWNDTVRLDIRYIRNWSFLLDFKILIKTVIEVLRCRGAV